MEQQDGSPTSQQSLRSRPNFPHPILLEDGGSANASAGPVDGSPNSPNSPNSAIYAPEYDPEVPFPHTDGPYRYPPNGPSLSNPAMAMGRIGSGPSSPTGAYNPHHFNPNQQPVLSNTGPSSPQYASTSSSHSPPRIPEPDYYQGVLPFGPPAPSQAISNMSPGPNGGYICNLCSLIFTRAHDARRHYTSKHSDVKSQCMCGKKFSRRDALLRHQRPDTVSGYGGCEEARMATQSDP